ncbi:aspartate/glutamate racemase family protein [Oxalobacteraceae bacterium OTU3CAMAD1]|nr:aspartate/glutamate racemase family protein [Oxalobacteraceae bacterium OTU3CAMAD1]
MTSTQTCIGIIGGLGTLAGADVHRKMLRRVARDAFPDQYRILYEHHHFDGDDSQPGGGAPMLGRQLYVYDMAQRYARAGASSVMLPCFISHTFLHQLRAELRLPVISLMDAVLAALEQCGGLRTRTVGVLTSDYVLGQRLFERHLEPAGYRLVYPQPEIQRCCVRGAVYGAGGLQAGGATPRAEALLLEACRDLMAQGADVIVPGATDIAMVAGPLRAAGMPVLDSNQAYVDFAMAHRGHQRRQPPGAFKIGIVGGVGPAATVDFMDKIISNTDATRDQDHIKLVVDHNPQIPDRTANLIGGGEDPTLAIYAACKRLEANQADLIAIPCNTAHAYVERIRRQLTIPIVNMLHETVRHIGRHHPGHRRVGLLATTGTIGSRVYQEAAAGAEFELLMPDQPHQALVMRAIYGERGVKAGYLDGECREDLMRALTHLVDAGATVVILGCTELPLLLREDAAFAIAGREVALLDPTAILARRCVALARMEDAQNGACRRASAEAARKITG